MDQELKAKWIAALRGGEFHQLTPGDVDWRKNGKHCCVGVLGELIGEQEKMDAHNFRRTADGVVGELTIDMLVNMNDGCPSRKPATFSEIADYIERTL